MILLVPCERMRASTGETEEVISCVGLVLTDHDVTCHPMGSVRVPSLEFLVPSNENVWRQENVKGPSPWHHSVSGVFAIMLKMLILKYAQRAPCKVIRMKLPGSPATALLDISPREMK